MLSAKAAVPLLALLLSLAAVAALPKRLLLNNQEACRVLSVSRKGGVRPPQENVINFLNASGVVIPKLPEMQPPNSRRRTRKLLPANVLASFGLPHPANIVDDPLPFLAEAKYGLNRDGYPKLIHMSFKDKTDLDPVQLQSMVSWMLFNKGWTILMYDDKDLATYTAKYHPAALALFNSLETPVEKSDLWRYLVMCGHGGVYADTDTIAAKPVDEWGLEGVGALAAVENAWVRSVGRKATAGDALDAQFIQWTLVSKPGHEVPCDCARIAQQHSDDIASGAYAIRLGSESSQKDVAVLHRTGPHVWTEAVRKYLAAHHVRVGDVILDSSAPVGDLGILPIQRLGCHTSHLDPKNSSVAFAFHHFRGSWRRPAL